MPRINIFVFFILEGVDLLDHTSIGPPQLGSPTMPDQSGLVGLGRAWSGLVGHGQAWSGFGRAWSGFGRAWSGSAVGHGRGA